jgi:hypothetical protein
VLQRGPRSWELGLAGYLRAVSAAVGVLPGGVGRDFDPPAAYLALSRRCDRHPEHGLLLVWSSESGWELMLEHTEHRPAEVLARLGDPLVPEPSHVARFVDEVLAGQREGGPPARGAASGLAELLSGYMVLALPPGRVWMPGPDRLG